MAQTAQMNQPPAKRPAGRLWQTSIEAARLPPFAFPTSRGRTGRLPMSLWNSALLSIQSFVSQLRTNPLSFESARTAVYQASLRIVSSHVIIPFTCPVKPPNLANNAISDPLMIALNFGCVLTSRNDSRRSLHQNPELRDQNPF